MNLFVKLKDFLLDLIFPKYCVGCQKEGVWLCPECSQKILIIKTPFCPECNRLTPKGQFCSRCRQKSSLTGVIIAAHYEEGPLKEAIHTYKYDGIFDLKYDLSKLLIRALKIRKFDNSWVLIPVPLHRHRQAERGFNQTYLLAQEIIKTMPNLTLLDKNLQKTKKSTTQVQMVTRADRLKNPRNSYKWIGKTDKLKGRKVILVDDIYTTGATLQECARVLRRNTGARIIWGLVLAKG